MKLFSFVSEELECRVDVVLPYGLSLAFPLPCLTLEEEGGGRGEVEEGLRVWRWLVVTSGWWEGGGEEEKVLMGGGSGW